nr:hypothetical protein [Actinacidiphila oryziradicis]
MDDPLQQVDVATRWYIPEEVASGEGAAVGQVVGPDELTGSLSQVGLVENVSGGGGASAQDLGEQGAVPAAHVDDVAGRIEVIGVEQGDALRSEDTELEGEDELEEVGDADGAAS